MPFPHSRIDLPATGGKLSQVSEGYIVRTFSISNKRRNEWIKLIAGLNAVLINRSECRGCGSWSRAAAVKGGRGKNSRERASYLALFSFSTREMKIKERAFVIYARRAALIYRPLAPSRRIERVTIVRAPIRNALL